MRDDNTQKAIKGAPKTAPRGDFLWEEYDNLPPPIRRAAFYGALPFHPGPYINDYIQTFGIEKTVRLIADTSNVMTMQSTREVYGTDHPQANEVWGPLKPIRSPRRRRV